MYPATLIENRFMNMKIAENGFEVIPIEFKDEIKRKKFYDILGKINEEIRLLSQNEITQGIWGSSVGHINYHSLYLKEIFELVENQHFFYMLKKYILEDMVTMSQ